MTKPFTNQQEQLIIKYELIVLDKVNKEQILH